MKDPRIFIIPCAIESMEFDKAVCDLGLSVNFMSFSIFEKVGIRDMKPMRIVLQLVNQAVKYPRGVLKDVLVKVGKFTHSRGLHHAPYGRESRHPNYSTYEKER